MAPLRTSDTASRNLAIALITVLNLVLVAWVLAVLLYGSQPHLGRYLAEGGSWMTLVAVLGFAQLAAALVLGLLHQWRHLPLLAYLATPILAVLAGLLGAVLGGEGAARAVADAPPDQKLTMWAASLALTESPRVLGWLLAAAGASSALVGCGLAAHGRRTPGEGRASGLLAAGTLAAAAAVAVVLSGVVEPAAPLHLILAFALPMLLAVPVFGLGAVGVRAYARSTDETKQGHAFAWALACGAALVASGLALAVALHAKSTASLLGALAHPGTLAELSLMVATRQAQRALPTVATIFAAAAVLGSGGLWVAALPALRAGVRRRWLPGGLAALAVALVVAGALLADARRLDQHRRVVESITPTVPQGIALAVSTARLVLDEDAIVALRGEELLLRGEVIGRRFEASTLKRLDRELRRAPRAGDRKNSRLAMLLESMEQATPPDQRYPRTWAAFHLMLDASTPGAELHRTLHWLGQGGARGIRLVVSEPGHAGAGSAKPGDDLVASLAARLGGDLERTINLSVEKRLPRRPGPEGEAALGLLLVLEGSSVTLRPETGEASVVEGRGGVDSEALTRRIETIRAAHPDESRVYLFVEGATSLQTVVDVLDAARETTDGVMLLTSPVVVASTLRPE